MSALWIRFTSSFLQNRSLVCSCPWDRYARRLSLRDDPESHFKEDCTILFHKNSTQSRYFFCLFIFWKSLICGVLCVDMQGVFKRLVWFYHKVKPRVYQKQNLALSWFKPGSTLSSKYECWCEFEKDHKVFRYSFLETIRIFPFVLVRIFSMFYIQWNKIQTEMYQSWMYGRQH